MEPVEAQPEGPQAGSPVTAKLWVAVRPKALVTVAVMVLADPQAGAVHMTWLVLAVFRAVASEPELAVQANVRELDCGSMAVTSKATVRPGEVAVADW